jgi:hypothetical protein
MAQEQANKDRAPLGSAPGYGDVTEGVVGPQGSGGSGTSQQEQSQTATPGRGQAGGGEPSPGGGEAGSGEAAPTDTPVFKEELPSDEKGTSLDEGGAG